MATGLQNEDKVPENLKKQLALAVRSIQWSYAIFWSISARQPGYIPVPYILPNLDFFKTFVFEKISLSLNFLNWIWLKEFGNA